MSNISINTQALERDIKNVQKELEKIKGDVEKAQQRALFDTAVKFSELSEPYIPVVTGFLKSSKGYDIKTNQVDYSLNTTYASKVEARRGYFRTPLAENESPLQDFFAERFETYFT